MVLKSVKQIFSSVVDILLPRRCSACELPLDVGEKYICRKCLMKLPRTQFEIIDFNAFEQRFAGLVPIERAISYYYYERESSYAKIIHDIKYHSMPQLGTWLAGQAAQKMNLKNCYSQIDYIVPVPLHFTKYAERGYNQSEHIAKGLTDELDAPVVKALKARHSSSTQTSKSAFERQMNTKGRFAVKNRYTKLFKNKHILLVDDVVTTGSTLMSCAQSLKAIEGVKVSLFTLAAAHLD